MKLLVCFFLIVVLLEEYNCAPYTRTRNRYRHHHGLQYGSSRHHSPYRSPSLYSRYGYGYQPRHYTYHPWRDSRHCTWHGSRYSSRHCSMFGSRHSSHAFSGYYPRYGTRHFIPNAPPMYNTEDKRLTEVTPIYMQVEKSTARPVNKSTEELVAKSTEKPLDITLNKPADNLVEEPLQKSKKATEEPVEKSTVKPTLVVTTTNPVPVPENKPQDIKIKKVTHKPVEESTVKPALAVTTTNTAKIPEDEPQDETDEKPLEPKPVEDTSKNRSDNLFTKPSPNSVKSSSEKLSDYSTASPFDDWPAENQSELSTENPF